MQIYKIRPILQNRSPPINLIYFSPTGQINAVELISIDFIDEPFWAHRVLTCAPQRHPYGTPEREPSLSVHSAALHARLYSVRPNGLQEEKPHAINDKLINNAVAQTWESLIIKSGGRAMLNRAWSEAECPDKCQSPLGVPQGCLCGITTLDQLRVIPLQPVSLIKPFQFSHKGLPFVMQFLILHVIYDGIERVAVF